MKKNLFAAATITIAGLYTPAAWSMPMTFVDLGSIGDAGLFQFDTLGSTNDDTGIPSVLPEDARSVMDTAIGLYDADGTVLAVNDDSILGLLSLIEISLSNGIYFLGMSEFSATYDSNFAVSGSLLEASDVGILRLRINETEVFSSTYANEVFDATGTDPVFVRMVVGPDVPPEAVPLPATVPLLIAGLAALAWRRRA
ncbi:MAG: PEP-CTERM sorting domain-containing protein [Candidatus Competibacterales bacterium]